MLSIELQWTDEAVRHIARHRVTLEEVEDVIESERKSVMRVGHGRYMVYGQTDAGRYLVVVIEPLGKGLYYPVTAFDMDETDRTLYRRRVRR